MKLNSTGNPFHDMAEAFADNLQRAEACRARLQRDGTRLVAKLPDDARSLQTFPRKQQSLLYALIDNGDIEALRFDGELFVTYRELEGYIGYGYDINDWFRDAAQPPSPSSAVTFEQFCRVHTSTGH